MFNYLIISFLIFLLGFCGLLFTSKHIILIIIAIELILISINFSLIIFSVYSGDFFGQAMSLFIFTSAAAESSLGLALLVIYFRLKGSINLVSLSILKG